MGAVFISYRRGDSEGQARALSLELEQILGKDSVFMDVDSIALGRDFRQVLHERLETCDIVLALIGPNWLDAKDANGDRRLESPSDFVRQEIATALQRNIAVTPVLLQGAAMPAVDRLPDDLKDLAFRNGFELSHTRWESDVRELLRRLGLISRGTTTFAVPARTTSPAPSAPAQASVTPPTPSPSVPVSVTPPAPSPPAPPPPRRSFLPWIAVAAILVVVAALAWMYFSRGQSSAPTAESASSPEPAGGASQPKPEREQRPASSQHRATPVPASNTSPTSPEGIPATATSNRAASQPFVGFHHLTSMFMESQNKCLESGDGSGPSTMDSCDNVSGQLWSIKPFHNGYYVLLSEFQAQNNKCFDSGTLQSTAAMRTCDGSPGQAWKLVTSGAAGYYRLKSQSMEPQNGCLESSNGSSPSKMNSCGNYSGQYWKVLDQ